MSENLSISILSNFKLELNMFVTKTSKVKKLDKTANLTETVFPTDLTTLPNALVHHKETASAQFYKPTLNLPVSSMPVKTSSKLLRRLATVQEINFPRALVVKKSYTKT
jgi:hypothetical protein